MSHHHSLTNSSQNSTITLWVHVAGGRQAKEATGHRPLSPSSMGPQVQPLPRPVPPAYPHPKKKCFRYAPLVDGGGVCVQKHCRSCGAAGLARRAAQRSSCPSLLISSTLPVTGITSHRTLKLLLSLLRRPTAAVKTAFELPRLPQAPSFIFARLCIYLHYRLRHSHSSNVGAQLLTSVPEASPSSDWSLH